MYYCLYNPQTLKYICKLKDGAFSSTSQKDRAFLFDSYSSAKKIIEKNNLPKTLLDRKGYIPQELSEKTPGKNTISPPIAPLSENYDTLKATIKMNDKKLKIINTYLKNIFSETQQYSKILGELDERINLIYHYIESEQCKTDEEKVKIINLLNETLLLRRKIKSYQSINQKIKSSQLLSILEEINKKTDNFEYWKYDLTDFIKKIRG